MKRALAIFVFCVLFVNFVIAQSIEKEYDNISLDSVLLEFYSDYNIKFAYDQTLAESLDVTGVFVGRSFIEIVEKILNEYLFDYEVINGTYVMYPRTKPVVKKKKKKAIHGIVKDKLTRETLPFANIYSSDYSISTISNQDGYFSIFDIVSDTISLMVSYMGYLSEKISLDSLNNDNAITFYMSLNASEFDEIIIQGETKKTIQIDKQPGLNTLNTNELKSLPNCGETDIFKLIQLLPGVKSTNESSSDLVIRGGTMDQNLILFDDFSIYHVDHFYGMFSAINPKVIKNIQLYKGGFDTRYGSRMNSVINIVGKDGNKQDFVAEVGVNQINAS